MELSKDNLKNIISDKVELPDELLFELPEKVLQFGTGVLLRGLSDYFIDKANRQGIFNGRIVVVKSTAQGDTAAFDKQDGLYTLCIRGLENGEKVEENIITSSISRVLSATKEWSKVLECAHNAAMQVIISNTTEVGIQLVHEDIRQHPPKSFPGKLLAFLYERFTAFEGSTHSGMVIIPTELIPENGTKLQSIVLELAHLNGLEDAFIEWLEGSNHFCNSLVDRIVPGKPETSFQSILQSELGYVDELLTMSEVYRLWAIEGGEAVRSILSFEGADDGVIIAQDIDQYRELKLRMLNGTHTLACGLAFLAGCETVKKAMDDKVVSSFIIDVMQNGLAPNIPYPVALEEAQRFGTQVLDRFRNPHIQHYWIAITINYSAKMRLRCLPVLLKYYEKEETAPQEISLGFAAYLWFMKATSVKEGRYLGEANGIEYQIQDEMAEVFYQRWKSLPVSEVVRETLKDTAFWGIDLTSLPLFAEAVTKNLASLLKEDVKTAITNMHKNKMVAA